MIINNNAVSKLHFSGAPDYYAQNTSSYNPMPPTIINIDEIKKIKPTPEQYQGFFVTCCSVDQSSDNAETNVRLAKEAVNYVKDMHLKSSTRMELDNPYIAYHKTEEYKDVESAISRINNMRNRNPKQYIEITTERVPKMGVGNCLDQAILAANYLIEQKNVKNVALIACTMKGQNPMDPNDTDQHVFAVIGLDLSANLRDPDTWGKNAVIVDPWGNISDTVKNSNPSKSGLNKLYALFRTKLMTFNNCVKDVDPLDNDTSEYNWENYRRNQLKAQSSIFDFPQDSTLGH